MSDTDSKIGQNLTSLREQASDSQASLAREMSRHGFKWSQATVWAVESGRRPLRLSEASLIAKHYSVSVEELLSETIPSPPTERTAADIVRSIEADVRLLRELTN